MVQKNQALHTYAIMIFSYYIMHKTTQAIQELTQPMFLCYLFKANDQDSDVKLLLLFSEPVAEWVKEKKQNFTPSLKDN